MAAQSKTKGAGAGAAQKPDTPSAAYLVKAKANGYRRAGRAWTTDEQMVAADDLTEAQLEQLLADPEITVTAAAEQA